MSSNSGIGLDSEAFERKLREAKNEITRQKDEELAKMHIQVKLSVKLFLHSFSEKLNYFMSSILSHCNGTQYQSERA